MELVFLDRHRLDALATRVNADPEFRLCARNACRTYAHHAVMRSGVLADDRERNIEK